MLSSSFWDLGRQIWLPFQYPISLSGKPPGTQPHFLQWVWFRRQMWFCISAICLYHRGKCKKLLMSSAPTPAGPSYQNSYSGTQVFVFFRNFHVVPMHPDVGNIKSFLIHSSGCAETGCEVRETRYANIKVKIVMKELSSNSRYFIAVAFHMCTYWGVSEVRALMGVIPGSFTYEAELKDMKMWGGGGRRGKRMEMWLLVRWRGPYSSFPAELHGAKYSTSRTHWVSHFTTWRRIQRIYWKEDCTVG